MKTEKEIRKALAGALKDFERFNDALCQTPMHRDNARELNYLCENMQLIEECVKVLKWVLDE